MSLLNNSAMDMNSKLKYDIMSIINRADLGLSKDNIEIANQFFDFDKEIDLSLLDKVTFQNYQPHKSYTLESESHSFINKSERYLLKNKDADYIDRYILFLDALFANTMYSLLDYNISYAFSYSKDIYNKYEQALSLKFDEDTINAKAVAMVAESEMNSYSQSRYLAERTNQFLKDTANNNPKIIFEAAKNYCKSDYIETELFLLGTVLSRIEPNSSLAEELSEEINYAVETIMKQNLVIASKHSNLHDFYLAICFMSIHHSKLIEKYLIQKISGAEMSFFSHSVIENTPKFYIEKNLDLIARLTKLKDNEEYQNVMIKTSLFCFDRWKNSSLLQYAAKNYPKQFIAVMYSDEEVSKNHYYYPSKYYCSYYHEMYKILQKNNQKAIIDYDIKYNQDIVEMAITIEQKRANVAKKSIGEYLRGNSDITILQPFYDRLGEKLGRINNDLIQICIDKGINTSFIKRYQALKSIQYPFELTQKIKLNNIKDIKTSTIFKDLIDNLIEEKVPLKYRFNTYLEFDLSLNSIEAKSNLENSIIGAMIKNKNENKEEYNIKDFDVAYSRTIFAKYLGETISDDNKETLFELLGDTSSLVKDAVIEIFAKHKEYEKDILELLKAKKVAKRESAVNILFKWGVDSYKETLSEMAENEKSSKLSEKIQSMLSITDASSTISQNENQELNLAIFVKDITKGGKKLKVSWLFETPNSIVHFKNDTIADESYLQAIILCYANMTDLGYNKNAEILANELNQEELNKFVIDIFSKWVDGGAEAKKKWILYFCLIHGGYEMIELAVKYIKDWAECSRGAIASEAVKALALNGSSLALMTVDNMSHKFKHKQVKNAATQALINAAIELGITVEELGDRIVPDLEFNENMERIFDYGTRKFKVYITPSLEIEVYDENNKKLKNMPTPSKKDDEETAKKSNTEFKQMKKQLKNVISIQKARLETVILSNRKWDVDSWNSLFVKNPIMHSFAIGLIWGAYEDNNIVQTFRYMEDGTFNTVDEDEYILPQNIKIGLVHPIELDEETVSSWKQQLNDYEITQPIEQLDRPVYYINNDEIGKIDLVRFKGKQINDMTLLGRMSKYGWYKGSVQDAGCFHEFYREDITKRVKVPNSKDKVYGIAVELHFSGTYVGGMMEEVTIENVRFYNPGNVERGSYVYDEVKDEKAIKLDNINNRYFSEIIYQLTNILKTADEED